MMHENKHAFQLCTDRHTTSVSWTMTYCRILSRRQIVSRTCIPIELCRASFVSKIGYEAMKRIQEQLSDYHVRNIGAVSCNEICRAGRVWTIIDSFGGPGNMCQQTTATVVRRRLQLDEAPTTSPDIEVISHRISSLNHCAAFPESILHHHQRADTVLLRSDSLAAFQPPSTTSTTSLITEAQIHISAFGLDDTRNLECEHVGRTPREIVACLIRRGRR